MKVMITGAAGFLGKLLVETLVKNPSIVVNGELRNISELILADIQPFPLEAFELGDLQCQVLVGDVASPENSVLFKSLQPDAIIHLAAVVSAGAEADFDLGMNVNLHGLVKILDLCRMFEAPPVFVLTSSVAVFSCANNETIDENMLPQPKSSYGTQKLLGEYLVRDYARKGFIKGRAIRFPTIVVRPGKPNKAASSFASSIIREPLNGQPATLPVELDLKLHLMSPDMAVKSMVKTLGLAQEALKGDTTITLPGISVSVGEMIETLKELGGEEKAKLITAEPDAAIHEIVASWPGGITAPRAEALGFQADANFTEIVKNHIDRYPSVD